MEFAWILWNSLTVLNCVKYDKNKVTVNLSKTWSEVFKWLDDWMHIWLVYSWQYPCGDMQKNWKKKAEKTLNKASQRRKSRQGLGKGGIDSPCPLACTSSTRPRPHKCWLALLWPRHLHRINFLLEWLHVSFMIPQICLPSGTFCP